MKKIVVLLCFCLLPINIALAKENKAYFTVVKESKKKLVLKVSVDTDDFDINAFLGDLKYNEKDLELIKIKGLNNFKVTNGTKLLADRKNITKDDVQDILELHFKVKKNNKTQIMINNVYLVNMAEQKKLDDIKFTYKYNNAPIILTSISLVIIVGIGIMIATKRR